MNRGTKLQWNLLTLLLLTATVATWASYLRMRTETERLQAENKVLATIGAELSVQDQGQFARIKVPQEWFDDHRWDVWLPEGNAYWLNIASRGIDPQGSRRAFPEPNGRIPMDAGRHLVQLETKKKADTSWQLVLTCDDDQVLQIDETSDWKPVVGTSTYSDGDPHKSSQHPVDQPLPILWRVHHVGDGKGGSAAPDDSASGVVVWISRRLERGD